MQLKLFIIFAIGSATALAIEPPKKEDIEENGITFKQMAQIQLARDQLFPQHLRDREGSLEGIDNTESLQEIGIFQRCLSNVTRVCDTVRTGIGCYGSAIFRFYAGSSKNCAELSLMQKAIVKLGDKGLAETYSNLTKNLGHLDAAFLAAEKNPFTGKNFSAFSLYDSQNNKNLEVVKAFFVEWRDNLSEFLRIHSHLHGVLDEILSHIQASEGLLTDSELQLLEHYKHNFIEKGQLLKDHLLETIAYVEFETTCDALRSHFSTSSDVALQILEQQLRSNVRIEALVEDLLRYGSIYGKQDVSKLLLSAPGSIPVENYLWSLSQLNQMTRMHLDSTELLSRVDAAYRIAFLMLQSSDLIDDYREIALQRQLALHGISLTHAYKILLSTVYNDANPKNWTVPNWGVLSGGFVGLKDFFKNNPMEAEILAAEIAHTYSSLANGSDDILGQLLGAGSNILNRRSATDFIRDVVFGKYDPVYEDTKMAPEFIALVDLSSRMTYITGAVQGLRNQNLASTVALIAASAIGVSTGTAVPALLVTTGKGLFGAAQAWGEKRLAHKLSSRSEVQAVLSGFLRFFKTGSVEDGIRQAASLFVARQLAGTLGTNWCDYREGRTREIILRAVGYGPLVLAPLYLGVSYFTGAPIDWFFSREAVQCVACTSALCVSQLKTTSKASRIQTRIDNILKEFDTLNSKDVSGLALTLGAREQDLKACARLRIENALTLSDDSIPDDSNKTLYLEHIQAALEDDEKASLTEGTSVGNLCETLFAHPISNQFLSPFGLLQLQMIAKAGGLG